MKYHKLFLGILIGIVILGSGAAMLFWNKQDIPVLEAVDELYMNDKGLIHAYPYKQDSQVLIGKYRPLYAILTANRG